MYNEYSLTSFIIDSLDSDTDFPSKLEAIVSWLLEHEDQILEESEDDSLTSFEAFSDSDSFSADDETDALKEVSSEYSYFYSSV